MIVKTNDFTTVKKIRLDAFSKFNLSESDLFDQWDDISEQFLILLNNNPVGSFRLRVVNDNHKIETVSLTVSLTSKKKNDKRIFNLIEVRRIMNSEVH